MRSRRARLRTRLGLDQVDKRVAGTDGLGAPKFDLKSLQQVIYGNRHLGAELVRDDLVRGLPHSPEKAKLAAGLRGAGEVGPQGRPRQPRRAPLPPVRREQGAQVQGPVRSEATRCTRPTRSMSPIPPCSRRWRRPSTSSRTEDPARCPPRRRAARDARRRAHPDPRRRRRRRRLQRHHGRRTSSPNSAGPASATARAGS